MLAAFCFSFVSLKSPSNASPSLHFIFRLSPFLVTNQELGLKILCLELKLCMDNIFLKTSYLPVFSSFIQQCPGADDLPDAFRLTSCNRRCSSSSFLQRTLFICRSAIHRASKHAWNKRCGVFISLREILFFFLALKFTPECQVFSSGFPISCALWRKTLTDFI